MTKETYKRKHLMGAFLTVSENQSTVSMVEREVSGRPGVGVVAESSHMILGCRHRLEELQGGIRPG